MGPGRAGGRWRWCRASKCALLAVALALGLASHPAAAATGQYDYWGRTPPLPVYVPIWSADRSVCRRIVRALNAARPAPASLYDDPIFLRWRDDPRYPAAKGIELDHAFGETMKVPFFNDGKRTALFKFVSPSSAFVTQYLFAFRNLRDYRRFGRETLPELLSDPNLLQPLEPFLRKYFREFIALPSDMNEYTYWSRSLLNAQIEINVADLDKKIYVTVRMVPYEWIVVFYFSPSRDGRADCLIGPRKLIR